MSVPRLDGGEERRYGMSMRGLALFLLLSATMAAQDEAAWRRDLSRPVPSARAVREVAAALFDAMAERRRAAAGVFALAHWPYLDRLAIEAFREEKDAAVLRAFFKSLGVVRPTLALSRALRTRAAEKGGAWRSAIDTLVFQLSPRGLEGCRVWSTWPGSVHSRDGGFLNDTSGMPLRRTRGKEIVLPWPVGAAGGRVLIGYRWDGEGKLKGRLVGGGEVLGDLEFVPGRPAVGIARVVALDVADAAASAGSAAHLVFDAPPQGAFWIQGLAVWAMGPAKGEAPDPLVLRAGSKGLEPGKGAALRRTSGLARLVIEGQSGEARFHLPEGERGGWTHLLVDHASKTPVTFDLLLDGRPLIRILSQKMPRGVRVSRRRGVGPGEHVLRFIRIQGDAPLELETLRLSQ